MEYRIKSTMYGSEYSAKDAVTYVNPLQAATIAANGGKLLDVYPSRDRRTHKPVLVYVFNRKEVEPLYEKWCLHELS